MTAILLVSISADMTTAAFSSIYASTSHGRAFPIDAHAATIQAHDLSLDDLVRRNCLSTIIFLTIEYPAAPIAIL